jgi:integrase
MAGVRSKPTKGGLYQAYYIDWTNTRKYLTEETAKQALKAAMAIEKEHDEIRKGYRPAPNSALQHRKDMFVDVVREYLEWGLAQGGRKGRPWSKHHGTQRRRQLTWWESQLGLSMLGDLEGILPRAEKALRGLLDLGRAGKTVANYAEGLSAFCDWCVQRGYLENDPLKGLAAFDTTPLIVRRAMTVDEINRLLEVAPTHRRFLYETAFLSGLRANELRNLTVDDLDIERSGVHLNAAWTKNRRAGFQQLPRDLVERLRAFAETGEAKRIYEKNFKKAKTNRERPENPLFYVASQTDRVWFQV